MNQEYRDTRIRLSARYLAEVRELALKHRANDAYIRSLYEDAQGIGGVDYSRVFVTKAPPEDRLPDSVALLIEMKRAAEADAAVYFERKREARELLDAMGGTHGRLLLLRYVTVLPWVCVAETLNYSEDWCRHMLNDALCEFYDYLPHTYRLPEEPAI